VGAVSARSPIQPPAPSCAGKHTNLTLDVPPELVETIARRAAELVADQVAVEPWLDTKGAAEHLSCTTARIHDLVALGKLTPRRDSRRLLFKREDLDSYVEASV
jgi:hypothetical protein